MAVPEVVMTWTSGNVIDEKVFTQITIIFYAKFGQLIMWSILCVFEEEEPPYPNMSKIYKDNKCPWQGWKWSKKNYWH